MPAPRQWTDDLEALARAGRRVIAYRAAHGTMRHRKRIPMTQVEFAKKAGVSVGCVAAFETGLRSTRRDSVRRIAAACDLTVDELLADDVPAAARPAPLEAPGFTDEVLAIARIFDLAHTEVRVRVKAILLEHLAQRTDRPGVALRDALRAFFPSSPSSSAQEQEDLSSSSAAATGSGFPESLRKNGSGK